ncbi:hypothetical protein GGQ59_001611 [Parvularcula dongshanensis]|uniref:Sulfotransferase n=1 Tax=Parvularcula dongshanensis TaxID=1173995 RepID=A0A840I246_9PROT|nr:hypothetical protein [Parvularcula dongshanensis]
MPENEGQFLQDVYPAAMVHGGVGRFAFSPQMHPLPPGPEEANSARERLLSCWSSWRVGDSPVLLEKSPPNLTKIAWLRTVFPGAAFILLARDPRAVAGATAKWRDASHTDLVYHWHVAYDAALDAIDQNDSIVLRYEDMVDDPDTVLTHIGSALGLPPRKHELQLEDRFATLSNQNAGYLNGLQPRCYGRGAWDRLGYEL